MRPPTAACLVVLSVMGLRHPRAPAFAATSRRISADPVFRGLHGPSPLPWCSSSGETLPASE